MDSVDVLKSYLVSLGFSVDSGSLGKFDAAMKNAANTVTSQTAGIAKQVTGWQASVQKAFGLSTESAASLTKALSLGTTFAEYQMKILGVFGALSGAVVGLAEHVANADQEYRLFGLRMGMTQDSAKKLKIALDELGQPLELIAFDPELHARFLTLLDDQDKLQKHLGSGFEEKMRSIRDLSFQFTRLHMAISSLGAQFVVSLFDKLGTTVEDVTGKMSDFVATFQDKIPGGADKIAEIALPILRDTWELFKEIGVAIGEIGTLFTNVVGLLSGDTSITGAQFSFEKFGRAIQHVVDMLRDFVHATTEAERFLIHMVNAMTLAIAGHGKEALEEFGDAFRQLGIGSGVELGAVIGTGIGGVVGSIVPGGVGTVIGAGVGGAVGGAVGGVVGGLAGGDGAAAPSKASASTPTSAATPTSADTMAQAAYKLAQSAGRETGISPRLIYEQWAHETNGFTNRGARDLNNLAGIRYPGTTTYERYDSPDAFADRWAGLMKSKHYQDAGVSSAKTESEFATALKRGAYYEDVPKNYIPGMQRWGADYDRQAARATTTDASISMGDVNVYVTQPAATPTQIHEETRRAVREELSRHTQDNLAQLAAY
jgi:hypothetical protein